jgi:hypothetical protein
MYGIAGVALTMKRLSCLLLPLTLVFILAAISQGRIPQQTVGAASAAGVRVPVVLELFTSEGCSNCPPADALLAKLEERQPIAGVEIIALEEHVDYWDRQGWVDPFSSGQWTQRQQAYAFGFGDHGIYTPELVVNGRSGFVGSNERSAYRAVAGAVAESRTDISVSLLKSEKNDHQQLKVAVGKLQGAQQDDIAEIWLAITETALHSAVIGGENSGRDLHHAAVVRWLHKAGTADRDAVPSFTGESGLKLDSAWKRANLRLVAFVQEKRSRHILGATSARLEP